jgi:gliding motility-associated protein GldM
MAGGKETPRQKMIGMMYLVLTALLALQVSDTILEKFIFMDDSLEQSAASTKVKNSGTVERIQAAVEDAGNRAEDVAVLKKAQKVRAETSRVLEKLESLKGILIAETGGPKEGGGYVGAKEEARVAEIMITGGEGEKLKEELNGYTSFLSQTVNEDFSKIALDASENPVFKDNPEQKNKNFSEITFQSTPMVAGLASLAQFKTEVLNREADALDALARKVGAADMKFDNIVAMVRPESNVVAAGTKYKADLFIAASSSAVNPVMTINGKKIPVEGGMGKIEFPASATKYDKDNRSEQKFKASITVEQGGKKETYENTVSYFVTKPVIQVQSQSVQALYLNCGNELQINVPALGTTYNPSFSANGATAIKGKKTGEVTIIPKAKTVSLTVSSGGNRIGTEKFSVKRIPTPTIEVFGPGNKPVNLRQGEAINRLRSLTVKAVPDESFATFLPKDARYRVTDAEVLLARGSRPLGKANLSGQKADLGSLMSKAKPGDRLVIDIKKVQRMNFQGKTENVSIGKSSSVVTVPLN